MKLYSVEDFEGKADSLYRLVIIAARRAGQVNRPETRRLVATRSKKPTIIALEEIADGKWDHLPEQAFMYVGAIEQAAEQAEKAEAAAKKN